MPAIAVSPHVKFIEVQMLTERLLQSQDGLVTCQCKKCDGKPQARSTRDGHYAQERRRASTKVNITKKNAIRLSKRAHTKATGILAARVAQGGNGAGTPPANIEAVSRDVDSIMQDARATSIEVGAEA